MNRLTYDGEGKGLYCTQPHALLIFRDVIDNHSLSSENPSVQNFVSPSQQKIYRISSPLKSFVEGKYVNFSIEKVDFHLISFPSNLGAQLSTSKKQNNIVIKSSKSTSLFRCGLTLRGGHVDRRGDIAKSLEEA